ncbi:MAG: hypothetical protein JW860_08225 [Sedimentisphaerales bacterium]|nr:hypothetical protein [Sedimentisphaerales bacterium]
MINPLKRDTGLWLPAALAVLLLAGCAGPGPVPEAITRQEALDYYNRNVVAIEAFQADVFDWEVSLIDSDGHKQHHQHMGGKVYFVPNADNRGPASFYLMTKAAFDKALVIGSNAREFWMYILPVVKQGWWGKYEHRGKDCVGDLLIDPRIFLEFMGLAPLPTGPPYPAYKVKEETNIIEYLEETSDGFRVQREIILDRRRNLPRQINAYDANGKCIMQARLDDFKKLGEAQIPGKIKIIWDQGQFFRLNLWGLKKISRDKSRLFVRPERIPGIENYQQIDQACDSE